MELEFISFRDGFLGAMEEDFYLTLDEMYLPEVEFKAPNIELVLEELFVDSNEVIAEIKHKKGYLNLRDYISLGSDLYIALLYDSSYTSYEGSGILDKFRLDLNFDYEAGEYHDFNLWQVGRG